MGRGSTGGTEGGAGEPGAGRSSAEGLRACEVHYFRLDPDVWEDRLAKVVQAGANTVSFYVPWLLHEPEEGRFDFGSRNPRLDLGRWLSIAARLGLSVFVRPGPYVYAEMENEGLPHWLLDGHPEARRVYWDGRAYSDKGCETVVSYLHPTFLGLVRRWFAAVADVIKPFLRSKGGPISLLQLCNEIPHADGRGGPDHNPVTLGAGTEDGRYASFLRGRYGTLDRLSSAYGVRVRSWAEVLPTLPVQEPRGRRDYQRFYHQDYLPSYLGTLRRFWVDLGVEGVTFTHNAYNPRMIPSFLEVKKALPDLWIGADAYYSMHGPADSRSISYLAELCGECLRELYPEPPVIWECECGYWNDCPRVYAPELEMWLRWCYLHGIRGVNLYLFAGGSNLPRLGALGTSHDWQAPVAPDGSLRPSFHAIKRVFDDIAGNWRPLLGGTKLNDLVLGIAPRPGLAESDLMTRIQDTAHLFFCGNLSYAVANLAERESDELGAVARLLWVTTDGVMDAAIQARLLSYAGSGANLVVQGPLPACDFDGEPARALAEALALEQGPPDGLCATRGARFGKVLLQGKEVYVGETVHPLRGAGAGGPTAGILATTLSGEPAVVRVPVGRGSVTLIPFHVKLTLFSQLELLRAVLGASGVSPCVTGRDLRGVAIRLTEGRIVAVFLNCHPVAVQERVTVLGRPFDVDLAPYGVKIVGPVFPSGVA